MTRSKYFPTIDECVSHCRSNEDNIEIPADVYDNAICEGKISEKTFIRGDYDYYTAKVFTQSGMIGTLELDTISG